MKSFIIITTNHWLWLRMKAWVLHTFLGFGLITTLQEFWIWNIYLKLKVLLECLQKMQQWLMRLKGWDYIKNKWWRKSEINYLRKKGVSIGEISTKWSKLTFFTIYLLLWKIHSDFGGIEKVTKYFVIIYGLNHMVLIWWANLSRDLPRDPFYWNRRKLIISIIIGMLKKKGNFWKTNWSSSFQNTG